MKSIIGKMTIFTALFVALISVSHIETAHGAESSIKMTDEQVENHVKRSYQYVAMYNVNNKFAITQGGWNTLVADTTLKDHTMRDIARPNNDSLYISAMLDLRHDPIVLEMPAFDSKYVSLMITGYDHYVNIPMSTRQGDFKKPEKMLLFTERTEGYKKGQKVEGVDRYFEATGDFISAVFRVMPMQITRSGSNASPNRCRPLKLQPFLNIKGAKPSHSTMLNSHPWVSQTLIFLRITSLR